MSQIGSFVLRKVIIPTVKVGFLGGVVYFSLNYFGNANNTIDAAVHSHIEFCSWFSKNELINKIKLSMVGEEVSPCILVEGRNMYEKGWNKLLTKTCDGLVVAPIHMKMGANMLIEKLKEL